MKKSKNSGLIFQKNKILERKNQKNIFFYEPLDFANHATYVKEKTEILKKLMVLKKEKFQNSKTIR